jgi:hypothetical protein
VATAWVIVGNMSVFEVFKKESVCDRCSLVFPKSELNAFDTTLDGERENGEVVWLCRACLAVELQCYFRRYTHKAVVVHPIGMEWNAYHFCTFSQMGELFGFEEEWVETIRKLLPSNVERCEQCGGSAHFNWCGTSLYSEVSSSHEVVGNGNASKVMLCGECLGKRFAELIILKDLRFDAFCPPVDSDGFCTSWLY